MGMQRLKTISLGSSIIAATLAIQGVTPALGTGTIFTKELVARQRLRKEHGELWFQYSEGLQKMYVECELKKMKKQACTDELGSARVEYRE
jgi:hypothetical protein